VTTAIETFRLTRDFGPVRALDGLDLAVERGEIFGFLGPNGAGKSTALRLMLDLIRPTSGRATIHGHDCQHESLTVRSLVGQLAGEVRLYPSLSGAQHLELFAGLRGIDLQTSGAADLAERLQLNLQVRASGYSKGNRQKLGLVLALLGNPPVLLLDEPSSGLDPLVQHELWRILRERAAAGSTVFFSSHVMSEVELVCERVAILRNGRLIEVNAVSALKGHAVRHVLARFAGAAPPGPLVFDGVRELNRTFDAIEFEVTGPVRPLLRALGELDIVDIETAQPTLEELLMRFYEGEAPR